MDVERMASNVIRSVSEDRDEALEQVDQSIDVIIGAIQSLNENLKMVRSVSVAEKAAVDEFQSILDEAIAPYFADAVKVMEVFDK